MFIPIQVKHLLLNCCRKINIYIFRQTQMKVAICLRSCLPSVPVVFWVMPFCIWFLMLLEDMTTVMAMIMGINTTIMLMEKKDMITSTTCRSAFGFLEVGNIPLCIPSLNCLFNFRTFDILYRREIHSYCSWRRWAFSRSWTFAWSYLLFQTQSSSSKES